MTSASSPIRHPDAGSAQVMTKRAWWLVVLNFVVPGSAQVLAGNRRLGRFGLRATLALVALAVVLGVVYLVQPEIVLTVFTNSIGLWVLALALVFLALLWVVLTIDTLGVSGRGRAQAQRVDGEHNPEQGQEDQRERQDPQADRVGEHGQHDFRPDQVDDAEDDGERNQGQGRPQAESAESTVAGQHLRRTRHDEIEYDEPPGPLGHDLRGAGIRMPYRAARARHSRVCRSRFFCSTWAASASAYSASFTRSESSAVARIFTAIRPALRAPPIETVATGTPAGICTIERSESSPSRRPSGTGTPTTGSVVTEASMPGRCAAPPAPAMMTLRPRAWALLP